MSILEKDQANVTFVQLKEMHDIEIVSKVTKELALQISRNSAATKVATGHEILRLWTEKLLKVYAAQFVTYDWLILTDCLRESFQTVLSSALTKGEMMSDLGKWLQVVLQLLQWVQSSLPTLNLGSVCVLLSFALFIVIGCLSYYQKWKNARDLKLYIENTLIVHKLVLKTLDKRITTFNEPSLKEFRSLVKMIESLCKVGEQTTLIDIKTIVETWKSATKLISFCTKWSDLTNGNWTKRPIQFLLEEITRNIKVIYNVNTLQQPMEQVEKYLRVTNFYVKLLRRLATDLNQDKFPASKDFFKTYIASKLIPKYLINTEIVKVANKYVRHDLGEIFLLIYQHYDIRDSILDHMRLENYIELSVDFAIEYLRASVAGKDAQFIENNVEALSSMFEELFKDANIFADAERYNSIIELYAALTILCFTVKLKKYFKKNILHSNFCTAYASADVLLIVFCSYQTHNITTSDKLIAELSFWRRCNGSFALLSQNARQFCVHELLRHLFRLCKANSRILDGEIQLTHNNYRFFLALGLTTTSCTESTNELLNVQLMDELNNLLNKIDTNCSIEQYYKMVIYIELLSTANLTVQPDLLQRIFELIVRISEMQVPSFELLSNAAFKLATASVSVHTIPEATLPQIVQCLEASIKRLGNVITVSMLLFLSACSQHANDKIQETTKRILTSIVSQKDTQLWWNVLSPINMQLNKYHKVDIELYRRISCYPAVHISDHNCTELRPNKRPRLNGVDSANDLKSILNELSHKSKQVLSLSSSLDSSDCRTLHYIVNNLNIVLSNKK